MRDPAELLSEAYAPLLALSDRLADGDEDTGWTPTALPGWTVRDLVFHLAGDAQRALVALHTPAITTPTPSRDSTATDTAATDTSGTGSEVDTDEISYWTHWTPGSDGAQTGLRATRAIASQWSSVRGPADLHRTTARAVLHAVAAADPAAAVHTQGHVLTVRSLASTLAVEAAVHHLDLDAVAPGAPAPIVLAEVRRVCDALLGQPVPTDWDDVRWARLATGRAAVTDVERTALGAAADRLPLFG